MVGEVITSGHKLQGRGIVRVHLDMRSGEGWQEQWRRGGDLEFKRTSILCLSSLLVFTLCFRVSLATKLCMAMFHHISEKCLSFHTSM